MDGAPLLVWAAFVTDHRLTVQTPDLKSLHSNSETGPAGLPRQQRSVRTLQTQSVINRSQRSRTVCWVDRGQSKQTKGRVEQSSTKCNLPSCHQTPLLGPRMVTGYLQKVRPWTKTNHGARTRHLANCGRILQIDTTVPNSHRVITMTGEIEQSRAPSLRDHSTRVAALS